MVDGHYGGVVSSLRIEPFYEGPAGSGQGGWTSRQFAEHLDGPHSIALRHHVPLGQELTIVRSDTVQLRHGDTLIMEATPWEPDAVMTDPVLIEDAAQARSRFIPFLDDDISMTCFSCGMQSSSMQVHGLILVMAVMQPTGRCLSGQPLRCLLRERCGLRLIARQRSMCVVAMASAWRTPCNMQLISGEKSYLASVLQSLDGTAITSRCGMDVNAGCLSCVHREW